MCRQPQQRDAAFPSRLLQGSHQPSADAATARVRGNTYSLDLGSMVGIRGTAEDELRHPEDLFVLLADQQQPVAIVERGNDLTVRALEDTPAHRVERPEGHPGPQSVLMHLRKACTDVVCLWRRDAADAEELVGYGSSVEVVGPSASAS
jgi:hypothetical protein